ncbi:MAG: FecR domain-containing protein [Bacteroides sp.]
MREENHIEEWESVLLDYYSGRLNAEERREVEVWLTQSVENRKIGEDVHTIMKATQVLNDIKQVDAYKALARTKQKIRQRKRTPFYIRFQRVAAILIVPLLLSTLYLATKQEPVRYVEVRTNPGMVSAIELPDGTKVWLNSRSCLKYPQTFAGDTREVELNGEAYFEVEKDRSKRFIVHTPFALKAEVLGTAFNLEAYAGQEQATTTLVSGSVKLSYGSEKTILMKPDEEVAYNDKSGDVKLSKPYIATQIAWKDGLVILRNTPFEEALRIVSKRFNVEFVVKNNTYSDDSFTGTFDGQHLTLILEHFRLASGIRYRFIDPVVNDGQQSMEKTVVELY